MPTQKIVVLGATSAIARATCQVFAQDEKNTLWLAARDSAELQRIANDLQVRYQRLVHTLPYDITQAEQRPQLLSQLTVQTEVDGLMIAIGEESKNIQPLLAVNFTYIVEVLEQWAAYFSTRKKGWIIVISSVAGDRGRQRNYLYGAAKGGLSIYLQGLRQRLWRDQVRVITIKPGFIDTPMTFGLPHLFLVASPASIAKIIAQSPQKNTDVIYVPRFWRWIMWIIIHIPEKIFKRLSF